MKQEITQNQWRKVPTIIRHRWNMWRTKKGYPIMPAIGTMIAFLGTETVISFVSDKWHVSYGKYMIIDKEDADDKLKHYFATELCDCLWQAVQEKV